jgi:hypothetical protein
MVLPGCRPEDFDVDALLAALQVELAHRPMTIDLTVPSAPPEHHPGPEVIAVPAVRFPACDTTRVLLTLDDRARRRILRRGMDLRAVAAGVRPRAVALGIAELLREAPGREPAAAAAPPPAAEPAPAAGAVPAVARPALTLAGGRRWWLAVAFGTGVGVARGESECAWNEGGQPDGKNYSGYCVKWSGARRTPVAGGLASAPFHVAPEIGLHLTERLALSLQGRLQVATLADEGAADTAVAVLARGLWVREWDRLRVHVALALGGGTVRYRAPLGAVATNADVPALQQRSIVDTVPAGSVLFGPGVGVAYLASRVVALQAEVNALAAAPDTTLLVDFTLGVSLSF